MSNSDDDARARQHERAEIVENMLADVREDLGQQRYPTTSEELAATYADDPTELPNETESIESAFDRIDERFENPEEAYQGLVDSFEDGTYDDSQRDPGEQATWSADRVEDDRPPAEEGVDGDRQESGEQDDGGQMEAEGSEFSD